MSLELHLIGTMHFDKKGPERLRKFLDWIKPDIIALEIRNNQTELVKKMILKYTFEQRTAFEYSKGAAAEIVNIDLPLSCLDPLSKRRNETENIRRIMERSKALTQEEIELKYDTPGNPHPYGELCARECFMAAALEKMTGVVVFPVGVSHIFADHSSNLYGLLSHLNPSRYKLYQADSLSMPLAATS